MSLRAGFEQIRDLGSRLLMAQDTERARIARELHDDISQQLALLTMDLELIGHADRGDLTELTAAARVRTQEIARSVHDLSHSLHPAKLRLLGLVAALQAMCLELSHAGVAITFTHDQVPTRWSADVTLCLFRVVQEALQNAVKHSKARGVSVHLVWTARGLTVNVVDDGVGFDVGAVWTNGIGFVSMKERLEALGGSLQIRSDPGVGTRVEATVPREAAQGGGAMWPDFDAELALTSQEQGVL